ncbi:R3H domain-containing protein [Entamoeba marina]
MDKYKYIFGQHHTPEFRLIEFKEQNDGQLNGIFRIEQNDAVAIRTCAILTTEFKEKPAQFINIKESSTLQGLLFSTLMDENGNLDGYTHAKEIAAIANREDSIDNSMFVGFLDDCLAKGIDPSLELIRLEETMEREKSTEIPQPKSKYYFIHQNIYDIIPNRIPQDIYDGLHRIPTRIQKELVQGSPFTTKLDKLINTFVKSDELGSLEIRLENAYERLLCHGVASYYNLHSYSTGEGNMRVTRVKNTGTQVSIPSVSITEIKNLC